MTRRSVQRQEPPLDKVLEDVVESLVEAGVVEDVTDGFEWITLRKWAPGIEEGFQVKHGECSSVDHAEHLVESNGVRYCCVCHRRARAVGEAR
jgi:hypothetical protein